MEPKKILASNLQKLMEASPTMSTFPQITAAGGGSNGTLDRIRRMQGNTGIDKLAPLAAVFDLEPWQLLVKGLDATAIDGVLMVTVPAWPFRRIPLPRVTSLSPSDHAFVEGQLVQIVEQVANVAMPSPTPPPDPWNLPLTLPTRQRKVGARSSAK